MKNKNKKDRRTWDQKGWFINFFLKRYPLQF